MSLPEISVVIPTLNEAARIGKLLESLQNQSAPPLEILVVDGGSSDETAREVARFSGVRCLNCDRGTARQRNFGARAARGELLVFFDADDAPDSEFLLRVGKSFRRWPFAVACPWFRARDSGGLVRAVYFAFNVGFWSGQSTLRMGSGVCLIVPRAKFEACGGFDESLHLGEDIELIRKLCPRFGWHRHLLIGLETSGRRFEQRGAWRLMWFYARITPLLVLGWWKPLQKQRYDALQESARARRQK